MTAQLFGLNEVIRFPNTSPQNLYIFKFFAKEILFLNSGTGSLPVSPARPAKIEMITFNFLFNNFKIFFVYREN